MRVRRSSFPTPPSFNASSTLPRAVNHGNNAASWNMRPVLSARTLTVPDVGLSRPATMLSSVLFPHPDAPSKHTNSPGATSRLMWSSAATEARPFPNTFVTSTMETAANG